MLHACMQPIGSQQDQQDGGFNCQPKLKPARSEYSWTALEEYFNVLNVAVLQLLQCDVTE